MDYSVPYLRKGFGKTPADGGCILQVIDWIDRRGWSDAPKCVHPALRIIAMRLNDTADDKQRQKLLLLAPRLMGTNSEDVGLTRRLANMCAKHAAAAAAAAEDTLAYAEYAAAAGYAANAAALAYAANAAALAYVVNKAAAGYAVNAAKRAAEYAAAANADANPDANPDTAEYAAADAAAEAAEHAAVAAGYAVNPATAANAATYFDLLLRMLDEADDFLGRGPQHEVIDWGPVCDVMMGSR